MKIFKFFLSFRCRKLQRRNFQPNCQACGLWNRHKCMYKVKFRGQTICVNAHLWREEFHGQCVKICVCVQNCYCFLQIHSIYLYLTHYHFLLWLPHFRDQFLNLLQLELGFFQIKLPRNSLEISVQLKDFLHVHQNNALLDSRFGSIHKIHFTNSNQLITKIIHFTMWSPWQKIIYCIVLNCFKIVCIAFTNFIFPNVYSKASWTKEVRFETYSSENHGYWH